MDNNDQNLTDIKKELNRVRANLRYQREANKTIKKQNSFLRYDNYLLKSKLTRLERIQRENSYLIIELLKNK